MDILNEKMKLLRDALNLKQYEFADKLGLTASYISAIETGKKEVTVKIIKLLIELFDINPTWILGESELMFSTESKSTNELTSKGKLAGLKDPLKPNKKNPANISNSEYYERIFDFEKMEEEKALLVKKTELIEKYRDRFKHELESTNPKLYKLRQEADNFMYRSGALVSFHSEYLMKFSLLWLSQQLHYIIKDPENFSYQEFKQFMYPAIEGINEVEPLLKEANSNLRALLKFLKPFDSENVLEDYLLK